MDCRYRASFAQLCGTDRVGVYPSSLGGGYRRQGAGRESDLSEGFEKLVEEWRQGRISAFQAGRELGTPT